MKVAIILGDAQGKQIKPRLQSIKDNLNIDSFGSVGAFIDSALKRNAVYDRIVVLSTLVNSVAERDLYQYWGSTSRETSVIMIGKSNADEVKARSFLETFKTPVAATMLVSSTTVQLIAESVLLPASEITSKYGIKDFLSVEIDSDAYVPEAPKPVETKKKKVDKSEPKEKRTLIGALFGGKKSKKNQANEEQLAKAQEQVSQQKSGNENTEWVSGVEEAVKEPQVHEGIRAGVPNIPNQQVADVGVVQPKAEVAHPSYDDAASEFEWQMGDVSDEQTIYEEPTEDTYSEEVAEKESFEDDYYNEEPTNGTISDDNEVDFGSSIASEDTSFEEIQNVTAKRVSPVTVKEVEDDFQGDIIPVVESTGNDFEADEVEDESFEGLGVSSEPVVRHSGQVGVVEDDDNALVVGSAEESYRERNEGVRVVTKTVVQASPGGFGGSNLIKGIKSGRVKKTIIVTGDRGTGITSTAYSIATYLAKLVDVLYFDADIERHGLLNYINYNEFLNFEKTHVNGVKMCRTSKAFDSCVIPLDESMYILTSDYTCDVTNDELNTTQEVVTDRATDFGIVVVDCPMDKLEYMKDLLLTSEVVVCVEGSKRGFMNMLCGLEACTLPVRYKRSMVTRGTMLMTKCASNLDVKKLLQWVRSFYQKDEVDWMSMPVTKFDGKLNDKLISTILEG